MSDHSYAKSFCRLSVSIIALISVAVWARAVAANPCKADGQPCRTNQSCCGRVCVNSAPPGKRPFGTCCTRTTCTAAGAQCGLINDGSCPDMLNCGDCPAGQVCTGNVCETTTTTTTSSTTTTTICTPNCTTDPCALDDGCGHSCRRACGSCFTCGACTSCACSGGLCDISGGCCFDSGAVCDGSGDCCPGGWVCDGSGGCCPGGSVCDGSGFCCPLGSTCSADGNRCCL